MKKIVVITGSPHKNGTTAFMADNFIEETKSKGHEVYCFEAAFEDINPCTGCYYCKSNNGQCLFADSMEYLKPKLKEADVVVFVTPLYYFGMSAQLKGVVDRFYASNNFFSGTKEALLLSACAANEDWVPEGLCAVPRLMDSRNPW